MPVTIVTETGCDLPAELVQRYNIQLVPLLLRFGERELPDTAASRAGLWQRIEAGLPFQTSGPAAGVYEETFGKLVAAGNEVVCISLTGAHSVTFNSAWLAAQSFPGRVTAIDSRSLSLGYGLLVLEAARLAQAGADAATIIAAVQDMQARTQIRFFLESLQQVTRGGRLDSLAPVLTRLGRVLNIRAILTLNNAGRISLVGPARGRRGAIRRLLQDAESQGPVEALAVAHTRRPDEAAALAAELATRLSFPRKKILVEEAGSVFIAHAGEGLLGLVTVRTRA